MFSFMVRPGGGGNINSPVVGSALELTEKVRNCCNLLGINVSTMTEFASKLHKRISCAFKLDVTINL